MVLWWIGNLVLLLVVTPVVILFANRVLRTALEIRAYAEDVLEHGVALTGTLDSVPKLVKTKQLTGTARQLVGRYGAALARIQPAGPTREPMRRPERPMRPERPQRSEPLSARAGARRGEES